MIYKGVQNRHTVCARVKKKSLIYRPAHEQASHSYFLPAFHLVFVLLELDFL